MMDLSNRTAHFSCIGCSTHTVWYWSLLDCLCQSVRLYAIRSVWKCVFLISAVIFLFLHPSNIVIILKCKAIRLNRFKALCHPTMEKVYDNMFNVHNIRYSTELYRHNCDYFRLRTTIFLVHRVSSPSFNVASAFSKMRVKQ